MTARAERPRLSGVRATLDDVEHPLEPFWRGVIAYRLLTLVTVIGVTLYHLGGYARPYGALGVLVVMTVWTAVLSWGYLGRLPGLPDPWSATTRRTASATEDSSRTSTCQSVVSPGGGAATSSPMTCPPFPWSSRRIDAPRPAAAPVTTQTLPATRSPPVTPASGRSPSGHRPRGSPDR